MNEITGKYSPSFEPVYVVGFKCRGTVQSYLAIDGDYYVTTDFRHACLSSWKEVHRHFFEARRRAEEVQPGSEDWQKGEVGIFEIQYVALEEMENIAVRDKAVDVVRDRLEKWELEALREHIKNGGEL
jgi:hypothetical protein